MDSLAIGIGQDKMVEQVREGYARQGNRQIVHMGEVGLPKPTRQMHLLKDDVASWAGLSAPDGNMPLEGAELDGLVAAGMEAAQFVK